MLLCRWWRQQALALFPSFEIDKLDFVCLNFNWNAKQHKHIKCTNNIFFLIHSHNKAILLEHDCNFVGILYAVPVNSIRQNKRITTKKGRCSIVFLQGIQCKIFTSKKISSIIYEHCWFFSSFVSFYEDGNLFDQMFSEEIFQHHVNLSVLWSSQEKSRLVFDYSSQKWNEQWASSMSRIDGNSSKRRMPITWNYLRKTKRICFAIDTHHNQNEIWRKKSGFFLRFMHDHFQSDRCATISDTYLKRVVSVYFGTLFSLFA